MEDLLNEITNHLMTQSWHLAVLVAVLAVVSVALKNRSAHVRYLLWLIVLAKCLMPPLLAVPLPVLPPERLIEPVDALPEHFVTSQFELDYVAFETPPVVAESIPLSTTPVDAATPSRTVRRELDARQWIAVLWIAGAAVFFLAAVRKALKTELHLRRQRKPLAAEVQSRIEQEFVDLGFRPFPKIWLLQDRAQPFVWGWLRGSIYLPADFVRADRADYRRDVLGHEVSHVLRFDAAINILQVIAQAIFWFHPFVWWANKRIRAEREMCCDEVAIARLGAKAGDYSNAIVEILICEHKQNRPVPSLAVAGSVRNVEERIKTMMTPGKRFYKRPSLIAATLALLLAILTAPTAFVLTARAEEKAESGHEELIAHDELVEPHERESVERPEEKGRLRRTVEGRRRTQREVQMRELNEYRDQLRHRIGQIERELEGLRDDQDDEAHELEAELRAVHEKLQHVEREFAAAEREYRGAPQRERREFRAQDLVLRRRQLQERAREIERAMAGLRDDQDDEAHELDRALAETIAGIREIDAELAGAGGRRQGSREPSRRGEDARRDKLMQERAELKERARLIGRELEELGDREEARGLRDEMGEIERRIVEIDRELRGVNRNPDRRQAARLEELRREIEHLVELGRHDEAARLERELHELTQSGQRFRFTRPEASGGDLQHQVRQLRGEVAELRTEMRELRELLHQLLKREQVRR